MDGSAAGPHPQALAPGVPGLLLSEGGTIVLLSPRVSFCLFVFSAKQLGISFWPRQVCLFLARAGRPTFLTILHISNFYRNRKRIVMPGFS